MCAVSMCASSIRALGETMSAGRSGRGRRCGWLSRRAGRLRRNAAVWVVMAMVLSLVGGGVSRPGSPSGGSGKPAPADASKDAKGAKAAPLQVGEVADLRTATSRTKRDATGRLTTTVYAEPVNYRDTSGRWVPIDTRLSATGDGWANTTNSFQTRFRRALSEGFLRLDVAGQPYTLSMTGAAAAPATVDGARVSYTGVGPGVDLRYELSAVGVKETLVLADAAAPTSYRFSLATPAGVTAVQRADGSVELRRAGTERQVMVLPAPTVADAPARDPTFIIQPDVKDATFFGTCPTCAGAQWPELYMGTDSSTSYRAAVQFNLSGIPAGRVDSAQLGLTAAWYLAGTDPHQINVHRITGAWTPTGAMPSFDSTVLSSFTAQPYTGYEMKFDVSNTVKAWLAGTLANNGFLAKRGSETLGKGGPIAPGRLSDMALTMKPFLSISYTTDAPTLFQPDALHSNGADLSWTRYTGALSGAPFAKYEVHRSKTANFTPSSTTLLMSTTDISTTMYRDTTAAPGGVFYYKVVANSSASQQVQVTLPADGQATKYLQPDAAAAKDTKL